MAMIERDSEITELRTVCYVLLCTLGVSVVKYILWISKTKIFWW